MARSMLVESTNIYRQLVTREGVERSGRWTPNPREGEPYKVVVAYGPYMSTNVGGDPWFSVDDTRVTIEIQKLQPAEGGALEWVTIKKKVRENEPSDLESDLS